MTFINKRSNIVSRVLSGVVAFVIVLQQSAILIPAVAFAAAPSQTITFGGLSDVTYGDADFNVTATPDASSDLPVTFSTASTACTVSNSGANTGTVHIVSAGSCTITADEAGGVAADTNDAATSVDQSFTINPLHITVSGVGIDKVFDGTTVGTATFFMHTAVGSDDVNATGTAIFDGSNVGPHGMDVTNITLTGTSASNYILDNTGLTTTANILAAPVLDTTPPVITLTGSSTIDLTVGDTYTEQGATATDNVDGTDPVTVGGDTVDTSTVGTYIVTYDAVDAAGNHATQVTRTVNVASSTPVLVDQTITFGALADKTLGDADFDVSATTTSGLPISFIVGLTDGCTITPDGSSTATVHLVSAGTCNVTAQQAGDASFNPASDVIESFTINPAVVVSTSTAPTCATSTFISDTSTDVTDVGPSALITAIPGVWAPAISGASWIWSEDPITADPATDTLENFSKTFNVTGTVASATLEIAVDNDAEVTLNGNSIASLLGDATTNNYSTIQTFDIASSSFVNDGLNTISFAVTNIGVPGDTIPSQNPAGLMYRLTVNACVTPVASSSAPATVQIGIPGAIGLPLISINGATPFSTTTSYVNPITVNAGDHFTVTGEDVSGFALSLDGQCDLTAVAGATYYCQLDYTGTSTATTTSPGGGTGTTTTSVTISSTSDISTTTTDVIDPSVEVDYTAPTASSSDPLATTTIDCLPASGSLFTIGTTTPVVCTASDSDGDTASSTFNITVSSSTPSSGDTSSTTNPLTISPTSDISTTTTDMTDPSVEVDYTTPDATTTATTTSGIATTSISCVPASGSLFTVGTTTPVLCTANDSAGNTATSTFNVTVSTTTPSDPGSGGSGPITPLALFSSSGGGSSGGGGSFGGPAGTTTPTLSNTLSCPFLTDYVIPGRANLAADIQKLQLFLNLYDNANLTINGILDANTIAAVDTFQSNHLSDVMGPWGLTTPSGQVYITTLKEINAIVCGSTTALTPAELAIINAYKAQFGQSGAGINTSGNTGSNGSTGTTTEGTSTIDLNSTSTEPVIPPVGSSTGTTTDNSSLVGNAFGAVGGFFGSIISKILSWL
jgi:hypothetical protein